MANQEIRYKGRIQNKHGTAAHWELAGTNEKNPFIPLDAELIVYDPDDFCTFKRYKMGDGKTAVHLLPFTHEETLFETSQIRHNDLRVDDLVENYILNINYSEIAFDTTEIVIGNTNTTSVLGQAILGQLVLG